MADGSYFKMKKKSEEKFFNYNIIKSILLFRSTSEGVGNGKIFKINCHLPFAIVERGIRIAFTMSDLHLHVPEESSS